MSTFKSCCIGENECSILRFPIRGIKKERFQNRRSRYKEGYVSYPILIDEEIEARGTVYRNSDSLCIHIGDATSGGYLHGGKKPGGGVYQALIELLRIQPVADSLHRLVIIVNPCHTLSQIEKGKKPVLCPILLEEDLIILPVRLIMNSLYAEPQLPDHSSVILISIVVPSVLAGPVGCGESGELRIDIVIIPIAVSNREKIFPIRLKSFYLITVTTFKPRYETVIDINIGIYAPLCRLIGYSRTIRRRIQRQSKQ